MIRHERAVLFLLFGGFFLYYLARWYLDVPEVSAADGVLTAGFFGAIRSGFRNVGKVVKNTASFGAKIGGTFAGTALRTAIGGLLPPARPPGVPGVAGVIIDPSLPPGFEGPPRPGTISSDTAIRYAWIAGGIGLLFVVVIMIGYYHVAGVLAVFALAVYVSLVLGGLSAFGATLTLPGIGGLILSIGMAVDANVLIFERIREELILGRATRTAVDEGFAHALSAIVDANITTLITAVILFQFGTGPVRGFAVTLSIGIIASFFSALYVTRTFFLIYLAGKKASDPISI